MDKMRKKKNHTKDHIKGIFSNQKSLSFSNFDNKKGDHLKDYKLKEKDAEHTQELIKMIKTKTNGEFENIKKEKFERKVQAISANPFLGQISSLK